jgi:DNA-binding response OmpR family regulator
VPEGNEERRCPEGERVLVVDDQERICRLLELILWSAGCDADSAASVPDALTGTRPYDVLVLDLMPRGVPGREMVRNVGYSVVAA